MKKLIAMMMLGTTLLGLTACGDATLNETVVEVEETVEESSEETVEESTVEETEETFFETVETEETETMYDEEYSYSIDENYFSEILNNQTPVDFEGEFMTVHMDGTQSSVTYTKYDEMYDGMYFGELEGTVDGQEGKWLVARSDTAPNMYMLDDYETRVETDYLFVATEAPDAPIPLLFFCNWDGTFQDLYTFVKAPVK